MEDLSKSNAVDVIWQIFHERLKDDVTSVTASVRYTDGTLIHPLKSINSSFTDKEKSQKSDYPSMVIRPVNLSPWTGHTYTKKFLNGTIIIEVYATASEVADKYLAKIINSIELYRPTLRDKGLRDVDLQNTDDDAFFDRGRIKLHYRSVTFSFRFIFSSTQTY